MNQGNAVKATNAPIQGSQDRNAHDTYAYLHLNPPFRWASAVRAQAILG